MRASKNCGPGRAFVEAHYDFSTKRGPTCKAKGIGRVYADYTLGMLPKDVRNYIVTDCKDWDIENSHPTSLLHACKKAGIGGTVPCLTECVENREDVFKELAQTYALESREDQKTAIIRTLNNGKPPSCAKDGRSFLHQLAKEIEFVTRVLMADPEYADEAAAATTCKGKVTFLHYVMTKIELDLLMQVAGYIQAQERTVRCLIYDGLLVESTGMDTDTTLLRGAEEFVLKNTACNLKLSIKPMLSSFTDTLKDVSLCPIDDSYAAGFFVDLYGAENLVLAQGDVHVFDKATGMWDSTPHSLNAAVHVHRHEMLLQGPRGLANYGGDATNIRKMLSLVPNFITRNDNFFIDNLDSSVGKLLFADGVYDFDSDTFAPGFDSHTVFTGRIDRAYDRHGSLEARAELERVLWQDPYTQQQRDDGVPLCKKIALGRALYGDYRSRKAYIVVGDTGTGKGVEAAALQKSAGSFVGSFDINNFVYNPNSGADQAKQLSWLKGIVDKRIAISSEARSNTTLCGMLVKQVVSGGDTITIRTNYKDEMTCINRSTLFMMCNDVPKISPCDDAVQDRIGGVFEYSVRFLDHPNPANAELEKARDDTLKGKLNRPEYQAAYLSSLLDAFQAYRASSHVIPASVSQAIEEWVCNDSSLQSLLEEACEVHRDPATNTALQDCFVPCDNLYQALVIEGVGPGRSRVCMSKVKLGKQLNLLGYPSGTRQLNGRNTRVRYGLTLRGETELSCF